MDNPRLWLDRPPVIERHDGVLVVRDDLLEGGSKLRFLPFLTRGAREVVYGGPFCGGAPLALSVLGKHSGQRITLFYAKRRQMHARQLQTLRNGARIYAVSPGYMTNVQAKARRYADAVGARFLPLGFDIPAAEEPLAEAIAAVRRQVGSPDQVWCAAGSGMLARCLGRGFPDSEVLAVTVGLRSRHGAQPFPGNVRLIPTTLRFEQPCRTPAPFPSCPNYDAKAWAEMQTARRSEARPSSSALFWNVLG